jgi:HD-GYP domain-containing protein (c-di-GMP phosphodiesterase class II)
MEIEEDFIRSGIFAGLDREILSVVAPRFERVRFQAGETVFSEGDQGRHFYFIVSGEVAILKGSGISRRELRRMGAGQGFGEMALISNEARTATVKAIGDTVLLSLDQDDFILLMERDARFAQRMLGIIASRLQRADDVATFDLMRAHQGLIISLAELAESRDAVTGAHLYRVRDYCTLLAKLMAADPRFENDVTAEFIEAIYLVSPLHDIGKVGIPDSILNKAGRLTPDEFEIIKTHTQIGARHIARVLEFCDLKMFQIARRLILSHHERYDGHGYPSRLKGEDIPLEARIMAIADAYDALLSKRSYKEAFSHEFAVRSIREDAGSRFDPDIVDIMLSHIDQFEEIHLAYRSKEKK